MNIVIKRLAPSDDLSRIVQLIRPSEWDDANEMEPYDKSALNEYLSHEDNILLVAFDGDEIVGTLLATQIYLPYATGRRSWMYVDELDTKPTHRRQGVARALMQRVLNIARECGIDELYVGTESDNIAARTFYESLDPIEMEQAVGYTFRVK